MQCDDFIDFLSYILIPSGWLLATTSILMEFEWPRHKLGLSKKIPNHLCSHSVIPIVSQWRNDNSCRYDLPRQKLSFLMLYKPFIAALLLFASTQTQAATITGKSLR